MLAGGGEACSDIERLRAQRELFGQVASDSTLYRTVVGLGAGGATALWGAAAQVRERLWADADRRWWSVRAPLWLRSARGTKPAQRVTARAAADSVR